MSRLPFSGHLFQKISLTRLVTGVIVVLIVASVGTYFLSSSHASSPYSSLEADNGSLGGGATLLKDPNASNGQYVQFGISPNAYLTASGTNLYLAGQKYQTTGINAYSIATDWGTNEGCGGMYTTQQMDSLFSSLAPYSLVRFWAFQGTMGINSTTDQIDWAPIDQVVNTAASYNIKLILTVGNQWGTCDDDHYKDINWYNGGYNTVYENSTNTSPYSYLAYLKLIVAHYANNPTIAMIEPINEPEASSCPNNVATTGACNGYQTCPNETAAAAALLNFFNTIGPVIRSLDSKALIEAGLGGGGQCGAQGGDYQTLMSSPYLDVASYHDYGSPTVALPGDQYNGLQVRINQTTAINKPLIVGETGIQADSSGADSCITDTQRASDMQLKISTLFANNISAFLPWSYMPGAPTGTNCVYDITQGDPLLSILNQYAFKL